MDSLSTIQTPRSASSEAAAGLSPNAVADAFLALLGSLMGTMTNPAANPAANPVVSGPASASALAPALDDVPADRMAGDPGRGGDGSAGLVAPDLLVAGMTDAASPPPAIPAAPEDAGSPPAGMTADPLPAAAPDQDGEPLPVAAAPSPDAGAAGEHGTPGGDVPAEVLPSSGPSAGNRAPADPPETDGIEKPARQPVARPGGTEAAATTLPPADDAMPAKSGTAPVASGDDAGPDDTRTVMANRTASDAEARPATADAAGSPSEKTDFADERGGDARGERRSDDPGHGSGSGSGSGSGGRPDRDARSSANILRGEPAEGDAAPAGPERTATAEAPPAGDADAGDANPTAHARPVPPATTPAGTTEAAAAAPAFPDTGDGVVLTSVGGRVPGPDGAAAGMASQPPGHGGQGAAGQPHPASEMVGVSLSRMADGRADRMTIQLRPAELGSVEVRLEFGRDGTVHARILAERPEALDLLQRDSKALEKSLQDAGFRTDSDSLSFDLRGGQQGERNLAGFRQAFGKARSRDAAAVPDADAIREMTFVATPGRTTAPGRVDIRI
ncbi:MAG TPA: flagellar hook-length control protein FliK [Arenibaculum sp.]|nr:flagellar hook-length control protein FliK [Arenibaculum sp.]